MAALIFQCIEYPLKGKAFLALRGRKCLYWGKT
jgi:hypothetical protein